LQDFHANLVADFILNSYYCVLNKLIGPMTNESHSSNNNKGIWYTYFGTTGASVFAFLWIIIAMIWLFSVLRWG